MRVDRGAPPAQTAGILPFPPERRRTADRAATVLGVFAHPDDEIFAAGLLAAAARRGARVLVAAATVGERGCERDRPREARGGARAPSPALGRRRAAELAASCRALGAEPPLLLGLPDSALEVALCAAPVAALVAGTDPDVVVTLGRDGAYGHLDHIAVTAALDAAPLPAGCQLLHALFPPDLFAPLRRALRRAGAAPLAADLAAADPGAADLVIDIDPELAGRKLAAIAAHASQLAGSDPMTFLAPGVVPRLLEREWYALARVGRC